MNASGFHTIILFWIQVMEFPIANNKILFCILELQRTVHRAGPRARTQFAPADPFLQFGWLAGRQAMTIFPLCSSYLASSKCFSFPLLSPEPIGRFFPGILCKFPRNNLVAKLSSFLAFKKSHFDNQNCRVILGFYDLVCNLHMEIPKSQLAVMTLSYSN